MPVETHGRPPYFNSDRFSHECQIEGCTGSTIVWKVDFTGPNGSLFEIELLCPECYNVSRRKTPLTPHEKDVLRDNISEPPYYPWAKEDELIEVYDENEVENIKNIKQIKDDN